MESILVRLPSELLAHIVSYLETARTLLCLSITCRRLHEYVEKDGFRVFVQSRFPSLQVPPYWKDATHAMTTLSRNWDRRAFIARVLEPRLDLSRSGRSAVERSYPRNRTHPHLPGMQTMGYQPVIDSFEEWMGQTWSSRKQILVWGAGPSLFLRSKRIGQTTNQTFRDPNTRLKKQAILDQHHHEFTWTEYKESRFTQGKDDITSVNLLRSMQKVGDDEEHVIIGRASGILNLVGVSPSDSHNVVLAEFETKNRPIRSASVSGSPNPLLAACLSDNCLALYNIQTTKNCIKPCDELLTIASGRAKTWSTKFLCHNRLAVGIGPSHEPVQIYDVKPDGLFKDPIRKIGMRKACWEASEKEICEGASTSVYTIIPFCPSSLTGGTEGDILLSGGYDGNVRLHDLRSPNQCTAIFTDLVDTFSPVYSLTSFGRERFIVGGARHSLLKIYDLRMPGGKLYYATDIDPCSPRSIRTHPDYLTHVERKQACCRYHYNARHHRPNTNIYMKNHRTGSYHQRQQDSPIYSLSSPSPCSPTFFVGVEESVLQIDVVSIMDRYPDPIFRDGPKNTMNQDLDLRMKWNPHSDVLCLPSYEQTHGKINLVVQKQIGKIARSTVGLDERWPLPYNTTHNTF